ncbi:MAG TPA: RluA family pseudouridine synthase [Patescibacteria group bacterium]|nr:RluA family pseudouridine synthase [Patescibacteria group bacterium]
MQIIIDEEHNHARLDLFVVETIPALSRAYAQKLCEQGKVLVNGKQVKAGHKLHEGNEVTIDYDATELDNIPLIDIPILYEDDDCVVMNKPAGVLTHSQGVFSNEATVASFLRSRTGTGSFENETNGRTGVVHRLDRATSGVIIGAKSQAALSWLQKQFSERKVKKSYIAIVQGRPKQDEAIIDMPIERNPKAPATFRVGTNGKPSTTHYKILQSNDHESLIELKPETGRTHQLRVHMAQIGHPIVGDPLYGSGSYGDRLFLHANSLEITLPNRERRTFTAPVPEEFQNRMQ